eukprot:s43_g53.t1
MGKLCHEAAESAWERAGVISSAKKRVSAAARVTELGAEVCGDTQTLGVGLEKLHKLLLGTLWLAQQKYIHRKHLQIMAGRWMFALQFRRPAMCIFQHVWKLITGTQRVSHQMRVLVKKELVQMVFLAPLLHCNLGAEIEPHIVATDASEKGCAVASSCQLTTEGMDLLQATRKNELHGNMPPHPILLISLFNGIGGCFRSYDIISCLPMGRIAVECDSGANRICARRWPNTLFVTDVKKVDRAMVAGWSRKFLQVREVHVWGGFPCTDLSAVKYNRQNLSGPNSSLFWEVPRIIDLIKEEFGIQVLVKYALENVASMDADAANEISEVMGAAPYLLDPCQAVPMRRPRFAWLSEKLESTFSDITVEPKSYWREVTAKAPYPPTSSWIEEGHVWEGEQWGAIFPTCLKSIPRLRPPPRPAGLQKCDEACKEGGELESTVVAAHKSYWIRCQGGFRFQSLLSSSMNEKEMPCPSHKDSQCFIESQRRAKLLHLDSLNTGPFVQASRLRIAMCNPAVSEVRGSNTFQRKGFAARAKDAKGREEVDVVVIGSGFGGLAAAGLLARSGREVLVCESHSQPGGVAHSFKRQGYEFDSGPSLLSGCSSPISANPVRHLLNALGEDPFLQLRTRGGLHNPAETAANELRPGST